jgi:hypothetical protein
MFETIKLEKSMYNISDKTFSQRLEELDPSENYIGTPYEGLSAYERQLKRFDIKISGERCDRVEKFFATSESAILFPEFVKKCAYEGINQSFYEDVFAVKTKTNSSYYNGALLADSGSYSTDTAQGNAFGTTTITESPTSIALKKYGRTIKTSYEYLRTQRIDVLASLIRTTGAKLGKGAFANVVTSMTNGASTISIVGSTVAYSDLVNLYKSFDVYNLTTLLVPVSYMGDLLGLEEFKDLQSDENGRIKLPFGTELIPVKGLPSGADIVGFDKTASFELITSSDIIVDVDKLIDTQMDIIGISISVIGNLLFSDSIKALA